MTERNKYPDRCRKCGVAIPAGEGFRSGPPWATYCEKDQPKKDDAPASAPVVMIEKLDASSLFVRPLGRLGAQWDTFKATCENKGARSRKNSAGFWETFIANIDAPGLVAALTEAKIEVRAATAEVAALLVATTEKIGQQITTDTETARARLAAADIALAPLGRKLRDYQREGVEWLAPRRAALLSDDMGLGKTAQALISLPPGARVCVVCPAVAKGVWRAEIAKWRPDLSHRVIDGRGSWRWPAPGEVVIANFDILPDDCTPIPADLPVILSTEGRLDDAIEALKKIPETGRAIVVSDATKKVILARCLREGWKGAIRFYNRKRPWSLPSAGEIYIVASADMPEGGALPPEGVTLVFDEAHNLKSGKAIRTQRARTIAKAVRKAEGRCWLLTATPLLNSPPELWAILSVADLERRAFGSWDRFVSAFGGIKGHFGGYEWHGARPGASDALREVMLRRTKLEVAKDIPTKTRSFRAVDMSAAGRKAADRWVADLMKQGIDVESALNHTVGIDTTGDPSEGIPFEQISAIRKMLATAKIPALLDVVAENEDAGEKLVVFSAHRAPIDALADRKGWAVITGDTSPERRTQIQEEFQAGKLLGVGATIKAGGIAITLTAACRSVFVDREWTPGLNDQAEDRVCRIGQTRPVFIEILTGDHPLDERIAELLEYKARLIEGSVEAARVGEGEASGAPLAPTLAGPLEVGAPEAAPGQPWTPPAALVAAGRRPRLWWPGEEPQAADDGTPRPAASPAEVWVYGALCSLSDSDPDCAREINGQGWNKVDGAIGKELLSRAGGEGLTDRGWEAALRIVKKYHRQIGQAPGAAEVEPVKRTRKRAAKVGKDAAV